MSEEEFDLNEWLDAYYLMQAEVDDIENVLDEDETTDGNE